MAAYFAHVAYRGGQKHSTTRACWTAGAVGAGRSSFMPGRPNIVAGP